MTQPESAAAMTPERASGPGVHPPVNLFDWSQRVQPEDAPEWMDGPCEYEEFRDVLRAIERINRLLLAYRPTLAFLRDAVRVSQAQRGSGTPLRILDVGSGGGDMLRRIERWARRYGIAVELTGADLNPYATRAAEEFTRVEERLSGQPSRIRWLTADAFALAELSPPDIILSALLAHHLGDDEIVRFLRWMETSATVGWFVNDLARSPRSYELYRLLGWPLRLPRIVRHDGPVSIRRAFREADWQHLCAQAEIAPREWHQRRWFAGRLCVGRLKR